MEDPKHLFEVLKKVLSDLTNREPPNTPVYQLDSQPGPDMVQLKQLLLKLIRDGYPSVETIQATKPAQPCSNNNEQKENVRAADAIVLESPISTTPDDFKSFEKWASTPQFKTVAEM